MKQALIKKQTFMVVLIAFLVMSMGYDKIDDHNEIMVYYEENSFMPIMHVYYNRHFSKSKQFQAFIETLEEAEYEIGSYAKILLTDC